MKTNQVLSGFGLSLLAMFLAASLAFGQEAGLPTSFRQQVEVANAVVVGRVEEVDLLSLLAGPETGVEVQELVAGEIHHTEIFLDLPSGTTASGTQWLLFLRSPKVEAREEVCGWTKSRTIYSLADTALAKLEDPANLPLLEMARQYARAVAIRDPEQKAQALASNAMSSMLTHNPILVYGAALDLQMIPDVRKYLSAEDHQVIAAAVLGADNGDFSKRDLIEAVGAAQSLASVDAVIFSLTRKNSANIREAAGRNLAYLKAPECEERLIRNLTDPLKGDPETQASLAFALGEIKSRAAVPLLDNRAIYSHDQDVRVEAILALGKIQDPQALVALSQTLSDSDPAVQRATLQALAWLDNPEAFSLLKNFETQAADPRMKLLAQMLLKVPKRTIPINIE